MDERSPGQGMTWDPKDLRTGALEISAWDLCTGFRERYHKLFDEVFTYKVCWPSHERVTYVTSN
ncbi:hypothetical protein GCM10023324_29330 [Streptomyces youssoufiensis]